MRVFLAGTLLVVGLALSACGGSSHIYVMTPSSPLVAGVYLTIVSPVPLPQGLLDKMKKGLTVVEGAQGPEVCKYSKVIHGLAGQYASLNGKTLTLKVNGSNPLISTICSGIQHRALNLTGLGGSPTNNGGSGEASKSATQVLTDAVNAADSASSLQMSGNVSSSGQQIGIDLSIAKGSGAKGSMTLSGPKVDLVIVGKSGYLKGGPAFWNHFAGSQGAMIVQLLAGRWLKFPVNNAQFQPLVAFSSPKALFDQLQSGADSALKNDGAKMYKGQSVVALDDGAKNGTLYVAATGTPYPVALVKMGSGGGTITFSNWSQPVSLSAPPNAVDVSHLTG